MAKDARKLKTAYTHECHVAGCKKRELVKFECKQCSNSYCIQHRHARDHKCLGPQLVTNGTSWLTAGLAAMRRAAQSAIQVVAPEAKNAGGGGGGGAREDVGAGVSVQT